MGSDYSSLTGEHYSTLKELGRSPRHFAEAEDGKESTDSQQIGTATHWAVFEPAKFAARVMLWERRNGARRGKAWDAFEAESALKRALVLTEDEHDEVLALARAVRNSPQVKPFFAQGGEAEVPLRWTDAETGLPCKARLDWICPIGIADLKTTKDASPEGFGRECARYKYHQQGGFYVDGYAASHAGLELPYFIIAAEKGAPHVVQVYRVAGDVLELGRSEMRAHLRRVAELRKLPRDQWPGYADGVLDLALPRWAMPYQEDNLDALDLDIEGASEEEDET